MIIVLLVGILYGISVLVRYDQTKKQNAQIAHIKQVQAAAQEETKRQKAEAAAEYQRVVELEMEQVRQAKELEKHEAWLRKHDEEIAKLQYKLSSAESDIEHWKVQIGNLYALLDVAQNELEQSIVGGKNQAKYQKQVITLGNQIHAAEQRLSKAEFERDNAQRKLEVA